MTYLLEDRRTLRVLKEVCRGTGVSVNLNYLSRTLGKHRNTIKKRVDELLKHRIINPPVFPFFALYRSYPLLITVFADISHTPETLRWMKEDKHIFAAFKIRRGPYNTMLILFHKNILNYHLWREHLTESGKIPSRHARTPSEAHFFSNQLMVEYEPNAGLRLLKAHVKKGKAITLRGCKIDELNLKILELLLNGKAIRVNEHLLGKKLGFHRKTLRKRLDALLKENIILAPVCRFPSFFVPPDCILQITQVEINIDKDKVLKYLKRDPHIPIAFHICEGRFNYLLFEVFFNLEEQVERSSKIREKFTGSIGMTDTTVLMETKAFNIDQQKVSLGAISNYIRALRHKEKDYSKVLRSSYPFLYDE